MTASRWSARGALRALMSIFGARPRDHQDAHRVIREFNRLFYDGLDGKPLFHTTLWLGVNAQKCPMDAWIYQEILWEKRPEVIIETGVCFGGSTLFLASMCDLIGAGDVIAVDASLTRVDERVRAHPRIRLVEGSSTDPAIVAAIRDACRGRATMVILDSAHDQRHVAAELEAYAPLVTQGHYLICEDTNINGHPVYESFGPGPYEAVQEFVREHHGWLVDHSRERLLATFNPSGYLLRKGV